MNKSSKFKQTEIGMIPEDWKLTTFREISKIRRGASPRPIHDFISTSGIPWVKISDASAQKTRFIEWTNEFIIEKGRKNTVIVKPGDLIVSNSATPGIPKFMKINAAIHDGWLLIEPNNQLDKNFGYYLFLQERPSLVGIADGTVFKNLKTDIVRSHQIAIPNINEQSAIAKILSSLDSKIELNQQINKTLEAIGQAIFKRWFIDFEFPSENGKPYKSSGGEMVDSELGEIPKGWKVGRLSNFSSEVVRGFTTSYVDKSNIINLNQKVLRGEYLDKSQFKYYPEGTEVPKNKFARQKDILINSLGQGTLGRVHLFWERGDNVVVDQHITIVRTNNKILVPEYTYSYLTSSRGQEQLASGITGSTGMLMLNISVIRGLEMIIPDITLQKQYGMIISAFYDKKCNNTHETEALSQIRDSLLPKLMSGKIRVPVEKWLR